MCRLLLFVGQRLSDTSVSSAKTDERIDVQFRKHTRGAPVNHVLIGGGQDFTTGRGTLEGHIWACSTFLTLTLSAMGQERCGLRLPVYCNLLCVSQRATEGSRDAVAGELPTVSVKCGSNTVFVEACVRSLIVSYRLL